MSLVVPIPVTYWDGLTKGVNFSLAGTGGPECVAFIPFWQKIVETLIALSISFSFTYVAGRRLTIDVPHTAYTVDKLSPWRPVILAMLCVTFGCEIGYKLSTSSVIWLANPCHILTMLQIVLLAAPPRKWVTGLFRVMMHSQHGAFLALLLPVTNTRFLPFEVVVYWVQHLLIVSIPFFLLSTKGPYVAEPLSDWTWPVLSLGILYFIYWIPIQFLCILTEVNINNMVCPAISDPFYGRGYRLAAMTHCGICILGYGKLYTYLSLKILHIMGHRSAHKGSQNGVQHNAGPQHSNGHLKPH